MVQKLFGVAEQMAVESETHVPPEVPETDEYFRFQHPGELIIERWHVEDDDVIEPGARLFDYHFRGKNQSRLWVYRGREPVRIWTRADESVSAEDPWIYSTVPLSWSPPEVSQWRAEADALAETKVKLADVEQESRATRSQLDQLNSLSSTLAFRVKLTLAFVLAACGFAMLLATPRLVLVTLIIVAVAIVIGVDGWKDRRNHHGVIQRTQQRLIAATADLAKLRSSVGEREQRILALHRDRMKAVEKARDAIRLLEAALSKAPSMCLPFRSLFAASAGDVVRIRQSQVGDFKAQSRRDVVITDDLPDWLGAGSMEIEAVGLYRVMERTEERIVLSRRQAFLAAVSASGG